MTHTLFYVAGIALVVIALGTALLGTRSDKFPSLGMMRGGLAVAAIVVVATLYGAVILAADEKKERDHNAAAAAEVDAAAAEGDTPAADEPAEGPTGATDEGGAQAGGEKAGGKGSSEAGAKVFVSAGCGGCHALASLGSDAQGTVGPDLSTALAGQSAEQIHESIVDPDAEITEGFPAGTMPATYEEQLSPKEIDDLVALLVAQAGS